MIKIVTGKLGAGKSLYSVIEIAEHLSKGRTVVTNIEIYWDELSEVVQSFFGVIPVREQLILIDLNKNPHFHREIPFGIRGHCVEVYLDELHLFFNSRDWAQTAVAHRDLISFFTQSRKAHVNMTLIVQESDTVEKQFRVMAEYEYYLVHSDHFSMGFLGSMPVKAFMVMIKDAKTGNTLRRAWKSYDKRFFGTYKTDSFLDTAMRELASTRPRVQPYVLQKVPLHKRALIAARVNIMPIAWLNTLAASLGGIFDFWWRVITRRPVHDRKRKKAA